MYFTAMSLKITFINQKIMAGNNRLSCFSKETDYKTYFLELKCSS